MVMSQKQAREEKKKEGGEVDEKGRSWDGRERRWRKHGRGMIFK